MKKCNVNGLISCSEKYSYVIYNQLKIFKAYQTGGRTPCAVIVFVKYLEVCGNYFSFNSSIRGSII